MLDEATVKAWLEQTYSIYFCTGPYERERIHALAADRAELQRQLAEAQAGAAALRSALLGEEIRRSYADSCGYLEVWRSWRDTMLAQGRNVPAHRMAAETLPQEDIDLDKVIAYDVVNDFVTWLTANAPGTASPAGADFLARHEAVRKLALDMFDEYGGHSALCNAFQGHGPCDCGWDGLLAQYRAAGLLPKEP